MHFPEGLENTPFRDWCVVIGQTFVIWPCNNIKEQRKETCASIISLVDASSQVATHHLDDLDLFSL